MAFTLPRFKFPFFERSLNGDTFYQINNYQNWGKLGGTNIEVAQNHPILTPAIIFVAKLFSQAHFYIEDENGKRIKKHPLLKLLKNPNYFQTQTDFFEALMFTQIAQGQAIIYRKKIKGFKGENTLYLLNPNLIEYPDEFRTRLSGLNEKNPIGNVKVLYDRDGENLKIPLKDLLFFYDLPNGLDTTNMFSNKSRIDGLAQTLINTTDSLLAKNIILKTNGKELITGGSQTDFPLSPTEKKDAEELFHANYGTGKDRKRGIITKAKLTWQSMHIALRDLGLDESVKVDGNLIYTALHIPKDILSLEAKKTTYNNFKESMVSYIQNEMKSSADGVVAVLQKMIKEDNLTLKATFEDLPIMQFILIERYEGVEQRAVALAALRAAGLPDEVCLELCDFELGITLKPIEKPAENGNQETGKQRRLQREALANQKNGFSETEIIEGQSVN
jgi:hypothetical protein